MFLGLRGGSCGWLGVFFIFFDGRGGSGFPAALTGIGGGVVCGDCGCFWLLFLFVGGGFGVDFFGWGVVMGVLILVFLCYV